MGNIKKRKEEHIKHFINNINTNSKIFEDIHFIHNSLPETNLESIDTKVKLGPWMLEYPIIINAITGGSSRVKHINESLALAAREFKLPIAVGSQKAGIEHPEVAYTYRIVRELYPKGIILANIGADASLDMVKKAVDMIEADGIQLHLNVPQEVIMPEGDKDFKGVLNNIIKIVNSIDIPVIVKETGFGISKETAYKLFKNGVKIIDIGGRGGTNFITIENERSENNIGKTFNQWGIPTAVSLIESVNSVGCETEIIASGGFTNGLTTAKALALGAKAVGIAGLPLTILLKKGSNALIYYLNTIITELKYTMLMLGAKDITELKKCPLIITGFTHQWLTQRGFEIGKYANRNID